MTDPLQDFIPSIFAIGSRGLFEAGFLLFFLLISAWLCLRGFIRFNSTTSMGG
jgi:hypothetical protein